MNEAGKNYQAFKALLTGTLAENALKDKYPFAYVCQDKELEDGGRFVSFRTGCNCDTVVSFTEIGGNLHAKVGHRYNYGNYECFCNGKEIREIINHGFGSVTKNTYDLTFTPIDSNHEQSYGCCCG